MVYELQREGRTFYSNSKGNVSALVERGWTATVLLGEARYAAPSRSEPTPGRFAREIEVNSLTVELRAVRAIGLIR